MRLHAYLCNVLCKCVPACVEYTTCVQNMRLQAHARGRLCKCIHACLAHAACVVELAAVCSCMPAGVAENAMHACLCGGFWNRMHVYVANTGCVAPYVTPCNRVQACLAHYATACMRVCHTMWCLCGRLCHHMPACGPNPTCVSYYVTTCVAHTACVAHCVPTCMPVYRIQLA